MCYIGYLAWVVQNVDWNQYLRHLSTEKSQKREYRQPLELFFKRKALDKCHLPWMFVVRQIRQINVKEPHLDPVEIHKTFAIGINKIEFHTLFGPTGLPSDGADIKNDDKVNLCQPEATKRSCFVG